MKFQLLIVATLFVASICEEVNEFPKPAYPYARIKTCSGWRLNSLPEVKKFVQEEAKYFDVEVEYSGGDPTLLLLNSEKQIVAREDLTKLSRPEIYKLLNKYGFYNKKLQTRETVEPKNDL